MCFAPFAWAALLAGITKTVTGKACNECETLVFKCSGTNVVFQSAIFKILVIRNKKGPQALTAKPANAFPEGVYTVLPSS